MKLIILRFHISVKCWLLAVPRNAGPLRPGQPLGRELADIARWPAADENAKPSQARRRRHYGAWRIGEPDAK